MDLALDQGLALQQDPKPLLKAQNMPWDWGMCNPTLLSLINSSRCIESEGSLCSKSHQQSPPSFRHQQKSQAFELYMAKVDAAKPTVPLQKGSKPKRKHDNSGSQFGRGDDGPPEHPGDGGSSFGGSSSSSESGDEEPRKKHKFQPSDMPWHN